MSAEHSLHIGFLIHDVSRLRRTVVDKALKPMNITRSQWWVLTNLTRHGGDPMMQTELARLMDVGKVTLGGLVDRLESAGYVQRISDPKDRRAKRIQITSKGRKLVREIKSVAEDLNDEILSDIPDEKIRQTEEVLNQMKLKLIEMEAVPFRKDQAS